METLKTTTEMIQEIINYTNKRIENWYKNVLIDYNVKGSGNAHYNQKESKIVVEYIEDGIMKEWEMYFVPEYLTNGIDWIFDCWSSLAQAMNSFISEGKNKDLFNKEGKKMSNELEFHRSENEKALLEAGLVEVVDGQIK